MIQPHKVSMTLFVIMSPAFTSPSLSILCIPYSEDIERVVFGVVWALSVYKLPAKKNVAQKSTSHGGHMTVIWQSHDSHLLDSLDSRISSTTVTWQLQYSCTKLTQQSHNSWTRVAQQSHNSRTTVTQQSHNNWTTVAQRSLDSIITVTWQMFQSCCNHSWTQCTINSVNGKVCFKLICVSTPNFTVCNQLCHSLSHSL